MKPEDYSKLSIFEIAIIEEMRKLRTAIEGIEKIWEKMSND